MAGSPTQLELFDFKPALKKHDGKPCSKEYLDGKRFAFIHPQANPVMMGPLFVARRILLTQMNTSCADPHGSLFLADNVDDTHCRHLALTGLQW